MNSVHHGTFSGRICVPKVRVDLSRHRFRASHLVSLVKDHHGPGGSSCNPRSLVAGLCLHTTGVAPDLVCFSNLWISRYAPMLSPTSAGDSYPTVGFFLRQRSLRSNKTGLLLLGAPDAGKTSLMTTVRLSLPALANSGSNLLSSLLITNAYQRSHRCRLTHQSTPLHQTKTFVSSTFLGTPASGVSIKNTCPKQKLSRS